MSATPDSPTRNGDVAATAAKGPQDESARIAELARATASGGSPMAQPAEEPTFGEGIRAYITRLKGGDIGALPAALGLVVLFVLFAALRPDTFLTPINIANLMVQASSIIVLAMGLTFVLLLGDIDLSAGVAGGASAAVMALVMNDAGLGWYLSIPAALLTGLAFGTLIGMFVARVGIPSFVVTLAFFLGIQGITLWLIGEGGTIPVRDQVVVNIANGNVPVGLGWVFAVLAAAAYALITLGRWNSQRRRGLNRDNFILVVLRVVGVAVVLLGLTAVLSQNRARVPGIELAGVPYSVPIIGVLLVLLSIVLGRTAYGRHVYAVGGNAEAARRAGINVTRIRISVFMIGSTLAAFSGIIEASRLNSVAPGSGGGNTLLLGVGAAVIGGTSLFGGKGKVTNAVIGGLVIATITNGLGLMGQRAFVNFLVTGAVLLLAAAVDAISRRRRASASS
ncbi:D-xylose transport system permease protein [Kineococcus xinjiangensis]|uniref:Xylose transport system permease protein XylH n=1 Tax=Kineococcus xinjiangensis TaxID=512762 RepID=A0A2S6IPM7_9ACTN|nr:ABC transporter permease [Kineococcus xinjiangensis]PPK96090.1 D-xylose transport system permease protein [Kineococcus xinjiangensis]